MTTRSLFTLILFAVAALPAGAAQWTGDTVTVQSALRSTPVRSFTEEGVLFIAVKDIAQLLTIDLFENPVLKKTELKLTGAGLKFTDGSSFVVLTNTSTHTNEVYQWPRAVKIVQGLYFVPAKELILLLNAQRNIALNIVEEQPVPVPAVPVVQGFQFEEKKNGSLLRIRLSAKAEDVKQSLQIGEWLYVTLPGVKGDSAALDTSFSTGLLRRIKPVQTETALQLSLQIRGTVERSEIVQDQASNDIFLTLIPPASELPPPVNADSIRRAQEREKAREQVVSDIQKQKKKWKLDVVVIDPGHGGHDPGAIGTIGTREKDITLGIGLKLGTLIRKELPSVSVVYTRKTDRFVELYRRGQLANEHEGKLFISIHCNSTERKPSRASGFEIYLLRPGKTEDAIQVAEKENDVVKLEKDYQDRYQNLTQENFIILTMAQSAYVKQSERFAEMLEETMSSQMESQRQSVKQAGFYVLVGASMPNVLVETGYLSNPREERFLRSPAGQTKIATAILEALKGFKREYEQTNE